MEGKEEEEVVDKLDEDDDEEETETETEREVEEDEDGAASESFVSFLLLGSFPALFSGGRFGVVTVSFVPDPGTGVAVEALFVTAAPLAVDAGVVPSPFAFFSTLFFRGFGMEGGFNSRLWYSKRPFSCTAYKNSSNFPGLNNRE